jgi:hypothetical protein
MLMDRMMPTRTNLPRIKVTRTMIESSGEEAVLSHKLIPSKIRTGRIVPILEWKEKARYDSLSQLPKKRP